MRNVGNGLDRSESGERLPPLKGEVPKAERSESKIRKGMVIN